MAYISLYSYFSSRGRFGVVANNNRHVKDLYLIPLSADDPVPPRLLPFEGPGKRHSLVPQSRVLLSRGVAPLMPRPPHACGAWAGGGQRGAGQSRQGPWLLAHGGGVAVVGKLHVRRRPGPCRLSGPPARGAPVLRSPEECPGGKGTPPLVVRALAVGFQPRSARLALPACRSWNRERLQEMGGIRGSVHRRNSCHACCSGFPSSFVCTTLGVLPPYKVLRLVGYFQTSLSRSGLSRAWGRLQGDVVRAAFAPRSSRWRTPKLTVSLAAMSLGACWFLGGGRPDTADARNPHWCCPDMAPPCVLGRFLLQPRAARTLHPSSWDPADRGQGAGLALARISCSPSPEWHAHVPLLFRVVSTGWQVPRVAGFHLSWHVHPLTITHVHFKSRLLWGALSFMLLGVELCSVMEEPPGKRWPTPWMTVKGDVLCPQRWHKDLTAQIPGKSLGSGTGRRRWDTVSVHI